MRYLAHFLLLPIIFLVFSTDSVSAQSGTRGSASRTGTRPPMRGSQGRPPRIGPVRSTVARPAAAPTGILNSVRHAPRSTGRGVGIRRPSLPTSAHSSSLSYGRPIAAPRASGVRRSSGRTTTSSARQAESGKRSEAVGARTWRDASGKHSIQGELAAYRNGIVWIRRTDGLISKLAVSQLSRPDQLHVVNSQE